MNHFDKTRRLLKKSDYNCVFQQAKKLVTSEFIVLYCTNTLGHARLGFALSKKMIAKAHDRNRIKRLLRESFRNTEKLPAVDLVFLARNGVGKLENKTIRARLGNTWNKLIALYAT